MLTVITPATNTALATVARARAMLGLPASDDAALQVAIEQASQAVVDHCRRPFARETVRETFRDPSYRGVLLSRAPVVAIASIQHGDMSLTPADWQYDTATGLLQAVAGTFLGCWYAALLTVEYQAGYTLPSTSTTWTLPAAVERATALLAGTIVSGRDRDPRLRSEDIPGVISRSFWVSSDATLPSPEAELLLQPYRRIVG